MTTSTRGKVPTGYAEETFVSEASFRAAHRAIESTPNPSKKRKREHKGDASVVFGANSYKGPWARYEEEKPDASSEEEEEVEVEYEEDEIEPQPLPPPTKAGTDYDNSGAGVETTEFHGEQQYDYQGRTYMTVPMGELTPIWMLMTVLPTYGRSGYQSERRHKRHQEFYSEKTCAYF